MQEMYRTEVATKGQGTLNGKRVLVMLAPLCAINRAPRIFVATALRRVPPVHIFATLSLGLAKWLYYYCCCCA
jgi:uncharacterized protein YcsI (UPF0317 family)